MNKFLEELQVKHKREIEAFENAKGELKEFEVETLLKDKEADYKELEEQNRENEDRQQDARGFFGALGYQPKTGVPGATKEKVKAVVLDTRKEKIERISFLLKKIHSLKFADANHMIWLHSAW